MHFHQNKSLLCFERSRLASVSPLMVLMVVSPGYKLSPGKTVDQECAVASGTYSLVCPGTQEEIEYAINIQFPDNYPGQPPDMYCNDPALPIGIPDRHIEVDGKACLGVRGDITMRWTPGASIIDFLEKFVAPFLAWQAYFDQFGYPPPWGQREHCEKGVYEFYGELLGVSSEEAVARFVRLLARKNPPKGHEYCPCGSGKKLRHCHGEYVSLIRKKIPSQIAQQDSLMIPVMKVLTKKKKKKFSPYC